VSGFGWRARGCSPTGNSARHNSHPYKRFARRPPRTDGSAPLSETMRRGRPWGTFIGLPPALDGKGGNALPSGLKRGAICITRPRASRPYIEDGTQAMRLIHIGRAGQFRACCRMGVFLYVRHKLCGDRRPAVFSADATPPCRFTPSQSGPIAGDRRRICTRVFLVDATSRLIRNGVGVSADGQRAYLVISTRPVTFHESRGHLSRWAWGLRDALYFDGRISRLYAPAIRAHGRRAAVANDDRAS